MQDERFTGAKHFWSAIACDRPRKLKDLAVNIAAYKEEGDFSTAERIQYLTDLTGIFPINLVMKDKTLSDLNDAGVPPISEYDPELKAVWFIPRKVNVRKTKNDKSYYVIEAVDLNNMITQIRCWGANPERDHIQINRPYVATLQYNDQWGFSTRSIYHNLRPL